MAKLCGIVPSLTNANIALYLPLYGVIFNTGGKYDSIRIAGKGFQGVTILLGHSKFPFALWNIEKGTDFEKGIICFQDHGNRDAGVYPGVILVAITGGRSPLFVLLRVSEVQ